MHDTPDITEDIILDVLENVLRQACGDENVDSMALTDYAEGLRLMSLKDRFVIEHEYGRRILGYWKE